MSRTFAFGKNVTENCGCPALSAGFTPGHDDSTEAAEWYDERVRVRTGDHFGVVDESVAREEWIRVVDRLRERRDGDPIHPHIRRQYEAARNVAKELGWL